MVTFDDWRKSIEITFDPHIFIRQTERNFDIEFVEETVRYGKITEVKSEPPRKICFEKYHGKEKQTYVVITLIHKNFIEVKTTWLKKGK